MATSGGKIGFAAGVAVAFMISGDMTGLILGECFFEEGCPNESAGLVAVAAACLSVGVAAGLLVREVVNRLRDAGR